MSFNNIIDAGDLPEINPAPIILDCRARLGDPQWGYQAFLQGHLPGAQHADLDRDLADPPNEHGRHPLPAMERWVDCIRRWGIGNNDQVVVYDDVGGAMAARAWWMFRWAGHEYVAVLDGGMAAWTGPLDQGKTARPAVSEFAPGPPLTRLIDSESLLKQLGRSGTTLVDARAEARWSGAEEPIDPVAGHIPGALCRPFSGNLDAQGRFRPPAELAARLPHDANTVYYCGSGVTAAHNILAAHRAGLPEPLLYADSWSGWISDPARPVETNP